MTFTCEGVRDVTSDIAIVDEPEQMLMFRKTGMAAVLWRRQPLRNFQDWIDGLSPSHLPSCRITLRPGVVREAIVQICDHAGTANCSERDRLVDDIAALAELFAGVTGASYLQLRLDVVTDNACRKFHIDAVTSRLVCTYRGTGTQYGYSIGGADPEQVFTVPTGAPVLLRGALGPSSGSNLLHRSPPIEGTGETRLVLVLDSVDNHAEADCADCSTHLRSLTGPTQRH